MKRLYVLVVFILFLLTGSAFATNTAAPTPVFDNMRTVIIAQTNQNDNVANYMAERLAQPFRIPYYQQQETSEILNYKTINKEELSHLATIYHADIVLVPVVRLWDWYEYQTWVHDMMITEYNYTLLVYAYDRKKDTFKTYLTSGFDKAPTSSLNQPEVILSDAMDELMRQLPYKRIPTDLGELNSGKQAFATKTTAGKAKILADSDVLAI